MMLFIQYKFIEIDRTIVSIEYNFYLAIKYRYAASFNSNKCCYAQIDNVYSHSFRSLTSKSMTLNDYRELVRAIYLYSLWLIYLQHNRTFAIPNLAIEQYEGRKWISEQSKTKLNDSWTEIILTPGKAQLNSQHLNRVRTNIVKLFLRIMGVLCFLIFMGGMIGALVYYTNLERLI
jgi:hypothetical protein